MAATRIQDVEFGVLFSNRKMRCLALKSVDIVSFDPSHDSDPD